MGRDHLSNDEFFAQLNNLFEHTRTKGHGSVYLTQKRLTFESSSTPPTPTKLADDPLWDTHPEQPLPILIRVSNNKSDKRPGTDRKDVEKVKLSTIVKPDELDVFYARYAEACKAGMSGLKKRDKKKAKKVRKKKKGGEAKV
ncbi:signal recognition particle, SRP9/SRP14 subunit [Cucurbitaria berberidis CBS 394.84]|uniref:Signal recognition particle subunit SRP14 n=1 Tax=Cucurbitaria berberidis CBS 394.84 TaxID=1168544 RepID=A0A9P4GLH7_9PLEO|nr:signal recognition particle, SRP9/SRP14 subunit [Cucurbitaria berberidis CBS 394.84]KAF1848533.1 signal recognition particle, SRP9/SRP14 subunit [Cucurbitaria berberidis CBS 394.84]